MVKNIDIVNLNVLIANMILHNQNVIPSRQTFPKQSQFNSLYNIYKIKKN